MKNPRTVQAPLGALRMEEVMYIALFDLWKHFGPGHAPISNIALGGNVGKVRLECGRSVLRGCGRDKALTRWRKIRIGVAYSCDANLVSPLRENALQASRRRTTNLRAFAIGILRSPSCRKSTNVW